MIAITISLTVTNQTNFVLVKCLVPPERIVVPHSVASGALQVCLHIIPSLFQRLRIAMAHQIVPWT